MDLTGDSLTFLLLTINQSTTSALQRFLGLLPLGDIHCYAQHPLDIPARSGVELSLSVDPAHGSVVPNNAGFGGVRTSVLSRILNRLPDELPVLAGPQLENSARFTALRPR